jgi:hypothetical protein
MAALAGAGVGGAVGGLTGALIGMGIPEYEAKRYEGRVKDGGILLSVHSEASEWTKKAKEVLERTGAQDISSTGEAAAKSGDRPRVREVALGHANQTCSEPGFAGGFSGAFLSAFAMRA